jgi:hypothetical protein
MVRGTLFVIQDRLVLWFFGLWHHVVWQVGANISTEYTAFIFRAPIYRTKIMQSASAEAKTAHYLIS